MTDNEIIKALECCSKQDYGMCEKCPKHPGEDFCSEKLHAAALDLINTLSEKTKELFEQNCRLCRRNGELDALVANIKAKYEELMEDNADLNETLVNLLEQLKGIKSEARKEFADRLKEKLTDVPRYDIEDKAYYAIGTHGAFIDNLLAEMESEGK